MSTAGDESRTPADQAGPGTGEAGDGGSSLAARRRRQPPGRRGGRGRRADLARRARYYGPVLVIVVAVAAVAAIRGGGGSDDDVTAPEVVDREELVRSGPMTTEKADLLGEDPDAIEFGPHCDRETGRVAMPMPYAPPCAEVFTGDNGGATATGVTEDTVKIVIYLPNEGSDLVGAQVLSDAGVDRDARAQIETVEGYADLYGRMFETYGRRVEVEAFRGAGAPDDHAAAKADAIAIAEQEPFAVVGGPEQASVTFADELAARGVVCLESCAVGLTTDFLNERAPYVWMPGGADQSSRATAEAVGKLAGPGPAVMAGDPELRERDRVYGVVHYDTPDGFYEDVYESLVEALGEYGIEVEADVEYILDIPRVQEDARAMVTRLKDEGVTTVIFGGDPVTPAALTEEATAQDYHPEWIHGGGFQVDSSLLARGFDQEQWVNGFGITPKAPATADLEVHNQIYQWAHGTMPPTNLSQTLEPPLRALAIGIHLAGPELTPETFREGLLRYPPSGGGPTRPRMTYDYNQGGGDAAIIQWDPDVVGVAGGERGRGMYRYADGGQRYALGEFPDTPEEAGLFDFGTAVVEYGELPPEDRTPEYPPPA